MARALVRVARGAGDGRDGGCRAEGSTRSGDDRTYEEWEPDPADIEKHGMQTPNGVCFLLNATELRHVDFQMDAVEPLPVAPTGSTGARTRRRARAERTRVLGGLQKGVNVFNLFNVFLFWCVFLDLRARFTLCRTLDTRTRPRCLRDPWDRREP